MRGKFGGHLEHASFFEDALDDKNWFKGMVRNVEKDSLEEACARNETVAKQAEPVYMYHRRKIAQALRQYDKPDGYKRLAVVQMNGIASGRPGEVAAMTPDVLKYDHNSHVPYAIWPQQKTHKHKASEACARSFSLCVDGLEERGRPRRSSRTASAPRATPLPRERKRRGRLATTPTTAASGELIDLVSSSSDDDGDDDGDENEYRAGDNLTCMNGLCAYRLQNGKRKQSRPSATPPHWRLSVRVW